MKYAFIILSLLISFNIFAKNIQSLNDSDAIVQISMFMNENHEDFASIVKISDKKINVPNKIIPSVVHASDVLNAYQQSFRIIMSKYPDEELPYEEALSDMEDYLDNQDYKRYDIDQNFFSDHDRKSIYFQSLDDKIHLRMDIIAPN